MEAAKEVGTRIVAIESRDEIPVKKLWDVCILVPVVAQELKPLHAEGWQAILWDLIDGRILDWPPKRQWHDFLSRNFFLIMVQKYRIVQVMNLNIFLDIQEGYGFPLKDNCIGDSFVGF